jgi:hypothetical protein
MDRISNGAEIAVPRIRLDRKLTALTTLTGLTLLTIPAS